MASTIKKRSPKKSQGDDSLKSSSIKRGIIKNQPKSQFDSSKDNFQSFQSEDLEDIHEFQDDLNSPTNEKYVKSKNLINRCEGAFHQLQILKDSWIRITIKNVKINDVVFNLPTLCYLGGFNLLLKISFGDSYEYWVDNAKIEYDEEKRILTFKDRSVFLMPSTRWGYAVIEIPQIHESVIEEEDEEPNNDLSSKNLKKFNKSNMEGEVRKDGFVPTDDVELEVSTLPTNDWIRCKSALKMGRALWQVVEETQRQEQEAKAIDEEDNQDPASPRSPRTSTQNSFTIDGKTMLRRKKTAKFESAEDVAMSVAAAYKTHLMNLKVSEPRLTKAIRKNQKQSGTHYTAKVDPKDEHNWHHIRSMPVHAEAYQSAAYQSFKELCGPVESVVSKLIQFLCGHNFIPDIVNPSRHDDVEAANDSDSDNLDEMTEEEISMKRHKAFLRAASSFTEDSHSTLGSGRKRLPSRRQSVDFNDMSRLEKKIMLARQRQLGQMSCDILYERLDMGVDTFKGLKYADWFKSSDLHLGLEHFQLSDRNLLLELVISFVNSQTTVMLLFYAVDIDTMTYTNSALMILIFVILEFLLVVASNAIQEKRARNFIFHKALRHGVLIDFENMDDPSTKYCQFPFVLGALAAILSAVLIMSEPSLSEFAKFSTLFLVIMNMNNGILAPFHQLAVVEEQVLSLPKFVEVNTDHAKKALVLLKHQDEYISLLHLRRIVQKQRYLREHAPTRYHHSKFTWDMFAVEDYQISVTKNSDISLHHPTSYLVRGRQRPWVPDEWDIPPVAADYLSIWYEKRNGKMQLPSGMDRSFDLKFLLTFFCYSLTGGIRGWNGSSAAAVEMEEEEKMDQAAQAVHERDDFMAPTPRDSSYDRSNSLSRSAFGHPTGGEGHVTFGETPHNDMPNSPSKRGGSKNRSVDNRSVERGGSRSRGMVDVRSTSLGRGVNKSIREKTTSNNTDALELLSAKSPCRIGLAAYGLKNDQDNLFDGTLTPSALMQGNKEEEDDDDASISTFESTSTFNSISMKRNPINPIGGSVQHRKHAPIKQAVASDVQEKSLHHTGMMESVRAMVGLNDAIHELEKNKKNEILRKKIMRTGYVLTNQESEYRSFLLKLNTDFNILSDHEIELLEEHVGEQALKEMLDSTVKRLEIGETEATAELKVDLRFMHYSFWRWTSILMELDFEDPMENAGIFRLRAFRFYSTVTMVLAASIYLHTAMMHSPAFEGALHGRGIVEHNPSAPPTFSPKHHF